MTDDKLPPWLSDNSDDSDENDLPDWLKDTDDDSPKSSNRSGVTGELSWMQDDVPSGDDKSKRGRASTGLTGELSWNQSDVPDFMKDVDDSQSSAKEDTPDWLKGDDESDFSSGMSMSASNDDEDDALPDWLTEPSEKESGLPEWLDDATLGDSNPVNIDDFELPEEEEWQGTSAFGNNTDTSTWGDFEGSSDTFTDDEEAEELLGSSAFTDDSWISETETPSIEEDFADLFAQSPVNDFNPSDLPNTGMLLFGEDDFSNEMEEETFDLLGTPSDVDSLLGDEEDFDLFGELSDTPKEDFDLFGEMSDEPETPIADALASDEKFLERFGADADIFADDDVDIDMLLGEEAEEDDPFRQFEPNNATNEPVEDDLSWLNDISNVPFQDTRPEPLFTPETRAKLPKNPPISKPEPELDIENYLASLDDVDVIPSMDLESADLDFENLFEDDEEAVGIKGLSPDAPSWLTDLSAVSAGENSAAAILKAQKDRPAEELPDRLKALRERGFEVQSKPKAETDVLSAIEPTSPVTMSESSASAIATVTLTAGQVQRAELLRTIVGNALEGEESKEKSRRQRQLPVERLFITVLLLVAVLAPFFVNNLRIGSPPPVQFIIGSHQDAFYRSIDSAPLGAYILIATEYGAMSAGELDVATESVIRHVLSRGCTPVIISSDAVGLVRADNLMQDIATENNLIPNLDYVVARYLVTDVVGLRDFSENVGRYLSYDVDGNPTGLKINSLNDFSRVIVISESADNLRLWGEQILPLMNQPFLVVSSYGAAPLAEPYLNTRVSGYLTGYSDAYTYQTMVNRVLMGGDILIPTLPTEEIVITTEPPVIIPTELTAEVTPSAEATTSAESTVSVIEGTEIVTEVAVTEATTELPVEVTTEIVTVTEETPVATSTPTITPTFPPTFTPIPTPTPIVERYAVITASTPINIRPDPSTNNPPVGALRPEERALILNEVTGVDGQQWYNITFLSNAGETVIGWVREDLVRIEESIVTPTLPPTFTPTPTPTPRSKKLDIRGEIPQKGQEPTPEITPEATPSAEVTAEVTLEVVITEIPLPTLPNVVTLDVPELNLNREIVPMDVTDRQARWDSMALGILVAVVVIAMGNLFNLVRVIFRKRRR